MLEPIGKWFCRVEGSTLKAQLLEEYNAGWGKRDKALSLHEALELAFDWNKSKYGRPYWKMRWMEFRNNPQDYIRKCK